LAYILREHTIVTPEHQPAPYITANEQIIVIVSLQGRDYQKDNSLVWQLLRPLVLEMAAWNYMKQFDATQDGHSAFLALQMREEGEAAVDARRAAVEEIIQMARYTRKSKHFSICKIKCGIRRATCRSGSPKQLWDYCGQCIVVIQ
jgi:hypothetical protein